MTDNKQQNQEVTHTIDDIVATLAEIQNTLATLPTEEKIRKIARDEAASVFRLNTKEYVNQFEELADRTQTQINSMQTTFSEMVLSVNTYQKQAEQVSNEYKQVTGGMNAIHTRLDDIFKHITTRQNDIVSTVNVLREEHESHVNRVNERFAGFERYNERLFTNIASEIAVVTGRNVLDEGGTKTGESVMQKVDKNSKQLATISESQAGLLARLLKLSKDIEAIREAPSPLIEWYHATIPAPARKLIRSKAFARGLFAVLGALGTAAGVDVFAEVVRLIGQ